MRYLDPKNDLTFKKIFAEHPHLLKSFLNAVLPLKEGQLIESLEYLSPELVPQVPLFKYTIVDVRCTDNQGRQFIVEMQMLWTDSFKSRVLFNASKAYVKQLEKGEKYYSLQPVYALSLINENFELNTSEHYHHYQIVNIENPKQKLEGLEFVFIELQKIKAKNLKEKKLSVLWLRLLAEIENGTENVSEDFFTDPNLKETLEILQESAFSKEELEIYDKYWDTIITEQTFREETARKAEELGIAKGIAKGMAKGMAKGEEIGIAKGIAKGIAQGEEIGIAKGIAQGEEIGIAKGITKGIAQGEHTKAISTAKNLKQLGVLSYQQIAQVTGLSESEIENL
jgi:predicted transposase/invertase (TIGR01784 family)